MRVSVQQLMNFWSVKLGGGFDLHRVLLKNLHFNDQHFCERLAKELGSKSFANAPDSIKESLRYVLLDNEKNLNNGHSGVFLVYPKEFDERIDVERLSKLLYQAKGAAASYPFAPETNASKHLKTFLDRPSLDSARELARIYSLPEMATLCLLKIFYVIIGFLGEGEISDISRSSHGEPEPELQAKLDRRRKRYVLYRDNLQSGGNTDNRTI